MKVGFITVHVKNLEESVEFYKNAFGLFEVRRFSPQEGVNIVFLKDEEKGLIELIENNHMHEVNEGALVSIGFNVEDLNEVLKRLREKDIEIIRGPIEVPSGEKFVFIKDPNGVEIELIEGFGV
ncbi:VOC family protein [Oceanirhabdus seepicola]|uniref:VOC family protein n=1 Tax=Oceanirhabdus seepicola TaxID=2828781 RepID=A0A9J6NZ04_9CLOT|nr:VOC family protein [Oceanirhabdus seepicola]MCM1989507.1 VOC family protein [Oceanirhabdus seepicola]